MHRLLRENGVPFDLVFILKDAGDYRSTLRDGIVSRLRRQSYEYILGARGGVHTVDASAENVPLLLAAAVKVIRSLDDFSRKSPVTVRPALGNRFFPPAPRHPLQYGYDEENSFVSPSAGLSPQRMVPHAGKQAFRLRGHRRRNRPFMAYQRPGEQNQPVAKRLPRHTWNGDPLRHR